MISSELAVPLPKLDNFGVNCMLLLAFFSGVEGTLDPLDDALCLGLVREATLIMYDSSSSGLCLCATLFCLILVWEGRKGS